MTQLSAFWTDPNGTRQTTNLSLSDNHTVDPTLPIVILLHGMGGDINHMATPDVQPGLNFDLDDPLPPPFLDRDWHTYPNVGFWSISTDPMKKVTGWQSFLDKKNYATLNYAQVDPWGLLARPVLELDAVVRAVLARFGKRVAFLCHSRGGLLLRLFLQRNRGDANLLRQIAGAVMVHVPNQGSQVADVAAAIHNGIVALRVIAPDLILLQLALGFLDNLVSRPAIAELSPGSKLLADLRTAEAVPLPVPIPIHTFGGTTPRLAKLRLSIFDAMSAVPQWHWPPFHWHTVQSAIPLLDGTPVNVLTPEERGGGDVLVTDTRSRLPGEASHHINPVSHPAALWDGQIQGQAETILRSFARS